MSKQRKQEIGYIKPQRIVEEIESSYLDYAMSVIIARALPDVRDGLKPVQRRILYAMHSLGLTSGAKFRKSATVVGETLGKYHPHGDVAVYDSMVHLAQDFKLRYPLIQGQGNFGSIDNDPPAAQRYTEAKLSRIAEEILTDIEKETVRFQPNYDGTHKEPKVLPAKLPNLLVNGTMGIAVGMATNIPPHNLGEVIDGLVYLIGRPDASTEDLTKFIKGPDFPTGGSIFNREDILQAYATGKGSIVMRAKSTIEESGKGMTRIVITEIPYQVNKAMLLERIADCVKTKKLEGIKDIVDESDREGIRIVIKLKKDAYPKKVLNQLYKLTDLQRSFHVNMVALVDGIQPQVLSLKEICEKFIEHREKIVTRRLKYDLKKALERAHILEGLKKALDHINQVVATIKKSRTREIAHRDLIKKFRLTGKQATAILEMKLQTLAGLERKKIEDELKKKLIKELKDILGKRRKILGVVKKELLELKRKYGDERRTHIFEQRVDEFTQEDLIPEEDVIITLTEGGYIKRLAPSTYHLQSRGGKGVIGMTTKEEDRVEHFLVATTYCDLLFFTNQGKVYKMKAYEIPASSRQAKGQAIVNFINIAQDEKVTSIIPVRKYKKGNFLMMVTKNGIIKKTRISDFANVRASGLIAIRLREKDTLEWVHISSGRDNIILTTKKGQAIHFRETDIRPMGRTASGVRGIRLSSQDEIVGMDVITKELGKPSELQLLVIMEKGYGKRTDLKDYKVQRRGGKGIKTAKVTSKTGNIIGAEVINKERARDGDLIIASDRGQVIRIPIKQVSEISRATQGVRVMRLERGDKVASFTCFYK